MVVAQMLYNFTTQRSMDGSKPAAVASPGSLLGMQLSCLTSDLLNLAKSLVSLDPQVIQ